MTCDEALKLLTRFIGGKLPPEQALDVRFHLRECKQCPRVRDYGSGIFVVEEREPRRERHHHHAPRIKHAF